MDRREAIKIIRNEIQCVLTADACGRDCKNCPLVLPEDKIINALELAIETLKRAVPCKECEHAWFKQAAPAECPYFCLIDRHYHKGDFFCRNGKPKVDET